jgi:hypothetical protein
MSQILDIEMDSVTIILSVLGVLVALSGVLTTVGIFILQGIRAATEANSKAILIHQADHTSFKERIAKNYYDKTDVDSNFDSFGKRSEQRMELILESINLRLSHLEVSYNKTEDGISGLSALLPELVITLKDIQHRTGK